MFDWLFWIFGKILFGIDWAVFHTIGIHNTGLCIILFTIVIYLILYPLNSKQQKSSRLMNKINPEIKEIQKKYPNVQISVTTIENRFFGEKITVSGLITGQDLKEQLSGLDLGEKLLISCSMLKGDEEIFLDDMTLEELSEALNTEIVIVDTGGRDLVEAVIYPPEHKQTRRRQIYEQTSSSDSGKA